MLHNYIMNFIKQNKEFFDKHPDLIAEGKKMDINKYTQKDIDENIIEYWENVDGILVDKTEQAQIKQELEKIKRELDLSKRREAYAKGRQKKKEASNEG